MVSGYPGSALGQTGRAAKCWPCREIEGKELGESFEGLNQKCETIDFSFNSDDVGKQKGKMEAGGSVRRLLELSGSHGGLAQMIRWRQGRVMGFGCILTQADGTCCLLRSPTGERERSSPREAFGLRR